MGDGVLPLEIPRESGVSAPRKRVLAGRRLVHCRALASCGLTVVSLTAGPTPQTIVMVGFDGGLWIQDKRAGGP